MADLQTESRVDFGALFDEHMVDEFVVKSAEETMTTMTGDPEVLHVPTSTGGRGYDGVIAFYRTHFVGTFPATSPSPASRAPSATFASSMRPS